jgi:hypothetical protein
MKAISQLCKQTKTFLSFRKKYCIEVHKYIGVHSSAHFTMAPVNKKQRNSSSTAPQPETSPAGNETSNNDDSMEVDDPVNSPAQSHSEKDDDEDEEEEEEEAEEEDSNYSDTGSTSERSSSAPAAAATSTPGKVKKSKDTAAAATTTASSSSADEMLSSDKNSSLRPQTPKGPPNSSKATTTPVSGAAMDTHPYARSSVIEVLHGVEDPSPDDWWSEDSDVEDIDHDDGDNKDPHHKHLKKGASVRLCDVIDRVSVGENKWRYYVHYRDFNRRMDEWVSMERIVSPPSIGNAKARAIKKEEEKQKRKQQRLEEKQNDGLQGAPVDLTAPRASRRRSSVQTGGGVTPVNEEGGDP